MIGPIREHGLVRDEPWFHWDTEVGTGAGPIDALLVSASGRVAIVETKLSYNPQRRREVVAQTLDYAVQLTGMDLDELPNLPDPGPEPGDVQNHLEDGDHLLIVAGDELDPRAVRLGRAVLGNDVLNPWDLAMVDLALFQEPAAELFVVVPVLRGQVTAETRQVVKIDLETKKIRVERVESDQARNNGRQRWTEETFFSTIDESGLSASFKDLAHQLVLVANEHPELRPSWGTGATNGSVTIKRNGSGLIEVYTNGTIAVRKDKALQALGSEKFEDYVLRHSTLFPGFADSDYPSIGADTVSRHASELLIAVKEAVDAES